MTVVHIADEPEPQIQRCSRCGYVLIDVRGAMAPVGQLSVGCWGPGSFVGVIEGNPRQSLILNEDATGPDQIPCNRMVQ